MKSAFNYDRRAVSDDVAVMCDPDEDLTVQQFKDSADINKLVARMLRGEEVPQFPVGQFGDFTNVPTFQQACDLVAQAQFEFSLLPAKLRSRFENSAAMLVDFLRDPANLEEAVRLGLVKPPKEDGDVEDGAGGVAGSTGAVAAGVGKPAEKAEGGGGAAG